jgi:ribosomal protein S18 acetylase RimI-like enzyme
MRANEFLTEDNSVVAVRPGQLSAEQLGKLSDFIAQGSEVSAANARAGVQRAQMLSYATNEQGDIIAITALKTPLDTYKTKVFTAAGVSELANRYRYEKGYSYTDPNYRRQGLNTAVSQKLLASAGSNIFATTRSDNTASKNNLVAQGFKQLGQPWSSQRGNYSLELWVND